jgi:hypothetical protein
LPAPASIIALWKARRPQSVVVCVASNDVLTIDDAANGTPLRFGLYHLAHRAAT